MKYPLPTFDSVCLHENLCSADWDICVMPDCNCDISFVWLPKANCISALLSILFSDYGKHSSFQAINSLCDNRTFDDFPLGIPGSDPPTVNPDSELTCGIQSRNIRFVTLWKSGTFHWLSIYLCDGRLLCTLRLSSLPFGERKKIPHQFIFHFKLLDLGILASKDVFQFSNFILLADNIIFRRSAFSL